MLAVIAFLAGASMTPGPDMRDVALRPPMGGAAPRLTLDAMPYARTVTCSTYTLTGSSSAAVTWSASPSGASGGCTGVASFSCAIDIDPDAVGEGVETITLTNGIVALDQTATIGFYVDGEHSCFLAQSVNGTYNAGLSDLDAVSTWENLGSSALDVTQPGAATLKPTYRTGIVGGQPVVRCDGGDNMAAAAAANWVFFTQNTDWSADAIYATSSANPAAAQVIMSTQAVLGGSAFIGMTMWHEDRAIVPANDRARSSMSNGAALVWAINPSDDGLPAAKFNAHATVHDNDGGAGVDVTQYSNYTADGTAVVSLAYTSSTGTPLSICSIFNAGVQTPLTGDVFRILIYQSALTSTQRGINEAVDEWALGGALPVTP
jgi:hypothetical protein